MGTKCGKEVPIYQPESLSGALRKIENGAFSVNAQADPYVSPNPPTDVPVARHPSQASSKSKHSSTSFGRAHFITHHTDGTLETRLEMGPKVGEGAQGVCFKAFRKADGAVRAVKRVAKATMRGQDVVVFRREVEIMKELDHPNIVKLYASFEDRANYYLVTEFCAGGELLDKIVKQGHLTEAQAASVVQQVLRAVFYMHEINLAHRDLKPENFLLADDGPISEDNLLKLIDFGIATRCEPGAVLTELCGTPFYVSPQVVTRRYDKRCDLWSVGVIMYTLLAGTVPFRGTDEEILRKVRVGIVPYPPEVWGSISGAAKHLIRGLLTRNPDTRMTAEAALAHKWIVNVAPQAKKATLPADLIDRLNSFRKLNVVKKAALQIVAGEMNDHELECLRKVFTTLDANGDGKLTATEITEGIRQSGIEIPEDFVQVLAGIDADGSGQVDYTEFLAATLDRRKSLTENAARAAFRKFDTSGDGNIKAQEIAYVLGGNDPHARRMYEKHAVQVVRKYGQEEVLNFSDFYKMLTDQAFLEEVCTPARLGTSPWKRDLPEISCEDIDIDVTPSTSPRQSPE
mmetsp:Transcript_1794/g.4043  ORF Transcript_1794/g.4043 Transcript_1794/m.4043 type:complete len:572 (-) Transcript_1794:316-2031(-)|eukprot:CAMPEP_0206462036 /NCGR_PEP_ID=MMETSP0324_2-20121206/25735_1 /ASSEMBLY_ACC=CAM_ASM_000836 /TAXON_ID=2866 /ORGANISM="Crypthecodinium cohnii, Strain Seligo" /LENGTH=571 /DNA_ID=CAMNT_0053934107 /DNA_START=105 /DNA_END=1820 /DNA_ORIENTATION=+